MVVVPLRETTEEDQEVGVAFQAKLDVVEAEGRNEGETIEALVTVVDIEALEAAA